MEVAQPSQNAAEMAAKARLYLSAGTRQVWVVWPHGSHIDVWRAENGIGTLLRTLTIADTLDSGDVFPGFAYPVAEVLAHPLR